MAMIRWQPWTVYSLTHPKEQLSPKCDHSDISGTNWKPIVELEELESKLILRAQLPGLEAKDLDINATRKSVTIEGEYQPRKNQEETPENTNTKRVYVSEFPQGKFQRTIALPLEIEPDFVKAELVNGILTLTLPKTQGAMNQVVKINLSQS